jgi:hypothetical protein
LASCIGPFLISSIREGATAELIMLLLEPAPAIMDERKDILTGLPLTVLWTQQQSSGKVPQLQRLSRKMLLLNVHGPLLQRPTLLARTGLYQL